MQPSAGATITGVLVRQDSGTWDVCKNRNVHVSDLKQRVGPYKCYWADVTMEQYGCSQSLKGQITFKDMAIKNGTGQTVTPK